MLSLPNIAETRYKLKSISRFSKSSLLAEAEELETVPDAQVRILTALKKPSCNEVVLEFEAQQFLFLDSPNSQSSRELSRSRDSDKCSEPKTELFERPSNHRKSSNHVAERKNRVTNKRKTPVKRQKTPTRSSTSQSKQVIKSAVSEKVPPEFKADASSTAPV